MSDLIDREALKAAYIAAHKGEPGGAYKLICEAPAVDAKPVRHGKWLLHKPRRTGRNATYKCSVCGKLRSSYYNDVQEWQFCPCGAKMDAEVNT